MNENGRLFAEQINDHAEKLNELMMCGSGDSVEEALIQRACLATRLLEGSTNMLGLRVWSETLHMFRELLERIGRTGTRWDEHLSQFISELLEAEQQTAVEIASNGCGRETCANIFEGLHREAEALLGESPGNEGGDELSLQFKPFGQDSAGPSVGRGEGSSTLDTLIASLQAVKEAFDGGTGGDGSGRTIDNLATSIGHCEFLFSIVKDIAGHMAGNRGVFATKVATCTVMDGVRDFFDIHAGLRDWRATLTVDSDETVLHGELARAMAMILERCIFDICTMHERRAGFDLKLKTRIANHGNFLGISLFDNGPDLLGDTGIESDDAAAFYKGLIHVRKILERWEGLLWVEPDSVVGERFRFTLPCSPETGEHRIIESSGIELAVPVQSIEEISAPGTDGIVHRNGDRYMAAGGRKVPVYRVDELAGEQMNASEDGDSIAVVGCAEKRIGIFMKGKGKIVEAVPEQLTESDWASLSTRRLHVGEREYPVLDLRRVMERVDYLKRLDRVPETPGSLPIGDEVDEIESAVPRVLMERTDL